MGPEIGVKFLSQILGGFDLGHSRSMDLCRKYRCRQSDRRGARGRGRLARRDNLTIRQL